MDWETQLKLIPGGTQTRSKVGRFVETSPVTVKKGQGAYIWGDNGRKYLDYVMGLGAILLGYGTSVEVEKAVTKQLREGTVFGLPSLREGELAELLLEYYPMFDMVKFGKNGVDATSAAVRLARAVTRKDGVAHSGYHGCADWYEGSHDNNRGIPEFNKYNLHEFEFNNIQSLREILEEGEVGTVILEQPPQKPTEVFYKQLRRLCDEYNATWIQDEIVTGFRYAMGGATEKYGLEPDLVCIGKAMANGLPISALLGGKGLMIEFTKGVSWSQTFGGELTSISASIECIKQYSIGNLTYYTEELTNRLSRGLSLLLKDLGSIEGEGGRLVMKFDKPDHRERYLTHMHSKNIFIMDVPIFISMAHTEKNIQDTITESEVILSKFKEDIEP